MNLHESKRKVNSKYFVPGKERKTSVCWWWKLPGGWNSYSLLCWEMCNKQHWNLGGKRRKRELKPYYYYTFNVQSKGGERRVWEDREKESQEMRIVYSSKWSHILLYYGMFHSMRGHPFPPPLVLTAVSFFPVLTKPTISSIYPPLIQASERDKAEESFEIPFHHRFPVLMEYAICLWKKENGKWDEYGCFCMCVNYKERERGGNVKGFSLFTYSSSSFMSADAKYIGLVWPQV